MIMRRSRILRSEGPPVCKNCGAEWPLGTERIGAWSILLLLIKLLLGVLAIFVILGTFVLWSLS